jgi:hypothetical protein
MNGVSALERKITTPAHLHAINASLLSLTATIMDLSHKVSEEYMQ